jgi:hypothetical protein
MKLLDMIDSIPQNVVLNAVRVDSIYVSYGDECKTAITEWEDTYMHRDTSKIEGTKNSPLDNFIKCERQRARTYINSVVEGTSFFDSLKKTPYHIEDNWNPPYRKKIDRIPKFDTSEYDFGLPVFEPFQDGVDYSKYNIFIQGYAGSNKTGIAVDYYRKKKDNKQQCKVLCYTNVALHHIISRGVDTTDGQTVANFLGWTGTCYTRATPNNFNHLTVDEYSMIDTLQWVKIAKKCQLANSSIHIFGDKYQCCSVEGEVKYDITKTQFIREMLGDSGKFLEKYSVRTSQYEPRCDAYINTIVTRMIDDPEHRLPTELFEPRYDWIWERHPTAISDTMICKTNKKVDYLNNKVNPMIKKGVKVIIHEINDKTLEVYNGERYIVDEIDRTQNKVYISEWCADPTIRYKRDTTSIKKRVVTLHYLKVANAGTAYKYQGLTLYEPYIIFEPHLMNLQEFIVSLTRGRKLSQMRITNKYQLQNKCFINVFESKHTVELNITPRVKLFNLYIIKENTPNKRAYIGITSNTLENRLDDHKSETSQCKCKDFEWDKSTIELIGKFVAVNVDDNGIEMSYIQDYNKFSEWNIVNYRHNNYNVNINSTNDSDGKSTIETVDLSDKCTIRESKDKDGSYFYYVENKSQRKARYGKTYTREQAFATISKKREASLKKYYPSI